jgi:hypothetical protein
MLPPAGTYIFRHDFLGDGNLRSCDASTQGIWINARLVMSGAPRYGELCFDDKPQNWKFDHEKAREFALSNNKRYRETTEKPPRNHRETTEKPARNHRETTLFRELEKHTSLEARVIARGIVKLVDKGVFHCNESGYIEAPDMVRERIKRENNAKRQAKFRTKGVTRNAFVTREVTHITPSPSLYNYPPNPPNRGAGSSSFDSQKRKRRRPTKAQIANSVGAETGNGSLAKFRDEFLAAGFDSADLEQALKDLDSDWRKINPTLNYRRNGVHK